MFEQAILESTDPGKRIWTTCAGVTGQMLLVCGIALAPLIWPQALPRVQTLLVVFTPSPPPPAPIHVEAMRPQTVRVATQALGKILMLPRTIPSHPVIMEDPPAAFLANGVPGGISGGLSGSGATAGIIDQILQSVKPMPPPISLEVTKPAPLPEPSTPPRVRLGGIVKMAVLLHRVDPQYPPLARQARIAGVVELEGVIGVDGRIRQLVVKSGHPLLVRAALDAVRQWVYQPTFLNGTPVEVIAPITVTFHLN